MTDFGLRRTRFSDVAPRHVGEDLTSVGFVHHVTFGNLDTTALDPASHENHFADRFDHLNECLEKGGRIIGRTSAAGVVRAGANNEYELLLQRITFIIGFSREPYWLEEHLREREVEQQAADAARAAQNGSPVAP
jgi:hypothetical protein